MTIRKRSPLEIKVTESHQCSVDLRLKILRKVPFFQGLPLADIQRINDLFVEKGFDVDEMICFDGDPATHLFVIAEGRVKLMRHSLAGKEIVLDLLTSGEFFGSLSAQAGDVYSDSAQAQTPVCILTIGRDTFRKILDRHPQVALKVLDIISARLRTANERLHQLGTLPVEARLANVLLALADKFGEKHGKSCLIQVPLSREDLGAMIGATPESTSRAMSQFQKNGLIDSGREWIAVLDRQGLEVLTETDLS